MFMTTRATTAAQVAAGQVLTVAGPAPRISVSNTVPTSAAHFPADQGSMPGSPHPTVQAPVSPSNPLPQYPILATIDGHKFTWDLSNLRCSASHSSGLQHQCYPKMMLKMHLSTVDGGNGKLQRRTSQRTRAVTTHRSTGCGIAHPLEHLLRVARSNGRRSRWIKRPILLLLLGIYFHS